MVDAYLNRMDRVTQDVLSNLHDPKARAMVERFVELRREHYLNTASQSIDDHTRAAAIVQETNALYTDIEKGAQLFLRGQQQAQQQQGLKQHGWNVSMAPNDRIAMSDGRNYDNRRPNPFNTVRPGMGGSGGTPNVGNSNNYAPYNFGYNGQNNYPYNFGGGTGYGAGTYFDFSGPVGEPSRASRKKARGQAASPHSVAGELSSKYAAFLAIQQIKHEIDPNALDSIKRIFYDRYRLSGQPVAEEKQTSQDKPEAGVKPANADKPATEVKPLGVDKPVSEIPAKPVAAEAPPTASAPTEAPAVSPNPLDMSAVIAGLLAGGTAFAMTGNFGGGFLGMLTKVGLTIAATVAVGAVAGPALAKGKELISGKTPEAPTKRGEAPAVSQNRSQAVEIPGETHALTAQELSSYHARLPAQRTSSAITPGMVPNDEVLTSLRQQPGEASGPQAPTVGAPAAPASSRTQPGNTVGAP